jgi:PKD repeat protein
MIARYPYRILSVVLATAVTLLTLACDKVPLLAPSGSTITLTSTSTALPLNGSADIIAQVIEAGGTPPQDGTLVTFTTNLGSIQPSDAETRAGRVTVRFNAGNASGTATIIATSGGASASGNNAIKIAIGAAAAGGVTVSANPGTVSVAGGSATITARVIDTSGNLLPNVPVTFTTDNGSLSAGVVSTDASGSAQTTLTTNKTAKVTATVGVSSGTGTGAVTAPTGSVTINVNVAATISVGTPSPAAPTVGIPVTFPLTITPNANGSPIVRVIVDFGDGSPAVTFQGTPTSATHTYNSAGSFTVRATAVDALGDTAAASGSVTVGPRPQPTITISASANATAGIPTTFTLTVQPAANSNTIVTDVTLDFGDGTGAVSLGAASGTITAQHVYEKGGTYTVTAVARDSNGGTASTSTILFVQDQTPLSVSITFTPSQSGGSTIVNFTATAAPTTTPIARYDWSFGDNSTATTTGNQITHTYTTAPGNSVVVTVTVTTTQGKTATGSTVVRDVR